MWQLQRHCNLRLPDAAPVLNRFISNTHAKFEGLNFDCRLIAFLLLTPYPCCDLTFDL